MGTRQETNIAPIQLVIMSVSVTVTVIDIIKVVSTFLLDLSFVFCTPTYLHKGDTTSSDHQQQSLFSISILHLINHILFLISQNFNHISITFQSNNSHPNLFHFHFLFLFIYFKPFHKLKPLPTIQHTRTITIYLNYLPMAPTKITFQISLNFLPTYLLSS